jgi:hypothetical protein
MVFLNVQYSLLGCTSHAFKSWVQLHYRQGRSWTYKGPRTNFSVSFIIDRGDPYWWRHPFADITSVRWIIVQFSFGVWGGEADGGKNWKAYMVVTPFTLVSRKYSLTVYESRINENEWNIKYDTIFRNFCAVDVCWNGSQGSEVKEGVSLAFSGVKHYSLYMSLSSLFWHRVVMW